MSLATIPASTDPLSVVIPAKAGTHRASGAFPDSPWAPTIAPAVSEFRVGPRRPLSPLGGERLQPFEAKPS